MGKNLTSIRGFGGLSDMARAYKAILFDMDGVITDTMPYHFRAWQQAVSSLGIHLKKEEVYKREGQQGIGSISDILAEHGRHFSMEELRILLEKKERIFKKMVNPRLFPGIESLIRDLKKDGYLLGLVTGTSRDELKYVLPSHLIHSFDIMVTGDSVRQGKPSPEPYLKAIEGLNIRAKEAIVIENAPFGIKSAKEAGALCIALATSLPEEYLQDADFICDSVEKVRKLLLSHRLGIKIPE